MLGGMAKVFDAIDDSLRAFIERQHVFFVATAPSGDGGHVNVSPKGGAGMFRVTGPLGFAYADMLGSGIETVAHLQENGRICVMFAAFEGPPRILRLHGTGRVVQQADEEFDELLAGFPIDDDHRVTVRSIVTVDVARVADACGYQVPRLDFVAERDQLVRYADNRLRKQGEDAVKAYVTENNAESIDGLRGLDPLVEVARGAAGRPGEPCEPISAATSGWRGRPSSAPTCGWKSVARKNGCPGSSMPSIPASGARAAMTAPAASRSASRPAASPKPQKWKPANGAVPQISARRVPGTQVTSRSSP